ncbi:MAG: hypothetical protein U5N58_00930 [Actinomycetota bacterium]|nr:hypothetical protein [Actinomycetota bacterium]
MENLKKSIRAVRYLKDYLNADFSKQNSVINYEADNKKQILIRLRKNVRHIDIKEEYADKTNQVL